MPVSPERSCNTPVWCVFMQDRCGSGRPYVTDRVFYNEVIMGLYEWLVVVVVSVLLLWFCQYLLLAFGSSFLLLAGRDILREDEGRGGKVGCFLVCLLTCVTKGSDKLWFWQLLPVMYVFLSVFACIAILDSALFFLFVFLYCFLLGYLYQFLGFSVLGYVIACIVP